MTEFLFFFFMILGSAAVPSGPCRFPPFSYNSLREETSSISLCTYGPAIMQL